MHDAGARNAARSVRGLHDRPGVPRRWLQALPRLFGCPVSANGAHDGRGAGVERLFVPARRRSAICDADARADEDPDDGRPEGLDGSAARQGIFGSFDRRGCRSGKRVEACGEDAGRAARAGCGQAGFREGAADEVSDGFEAEGDFDCVADALRAGVGLLADGRRGRHS